MYSTTGKKIDDEIINKSNDEIMINAKKEPIKLKLIEQYASSYFTDLLNNNNISYSLANKKHYFYVPSRYFNFMKIPTRPLIGGDLFVKEPYQSYFVNLEEKFKNIIEIRPTLNFIAAEILAIDKLDIDNNADRERAKSSMKYKKLNRLEKFYNLLTEFALSLLFEFYYLDFSKGQLNGMNLDKVLIFKIMPIVLKIKEMVEQQIHEDFPTDKIAQQVNEGNF
jgi:hypothetical protein